MQQREIMLLTAVDLIGTTQPGLPATSNYNWVTYPMADRAILTASEVL
jgi:hypothetical protein